MSNKRMKENIACVEPQNCVGCFACRDICPNKAIILEEKHGFEYPIVIEEKCTQCGVCTLTCPIINRAINEEYDKYEPVAYAAWAKDKELRYKSTSGGVFGTVSNAFIANGGYVCGCSFSLDYKKVKFQIIHSRDDIKDIIRTKYMQSDMEGVYIQIRKLLKAGEKVLFCGTPCQTAALRNYMQNDLKKLYIMDFMCKGVPSQRVHAKYVEMLEKKYKSKIIYFGSKSKIHGWGKFFTEVRFENGKVKYLRSPLDYLFVSAALTIRPACQSCNYKGQQRVSDIMIGDFWGIEGLSKKTMHDGISAMVVNTSKGEELVKLASNDLVLVEKNLDDIANRHNPGYSQSVKINPRQKEFFEEFYNIPFEKILEKYAQKNDLMSRIVRRMKNYVIEMEEKKWK